MPWKHVQEICLPLLLQHPVAKYGETVNSAQRCVEDQICDTVDGWDCVAVLHPRDITAQQPSASLNLTLRHIGDHEHQQTDSRIFMTFGLFG